tara:strand:+ start:1680 stop:2159 length:480 start_codon:yes stop_codon:yes gene_type:complete
MSELHEGLEVINYNWKSDIEDVFDNPLCSIEEFYEEIWIQSQTAFDMPREVQVIIDVNNQLFMSVGNPGFVSFEGQDAELYNRERKMKLPIVEWIHTHPFGHAYFSGTDWMTINMWQHNMEKATVLGNNERATFEPRNGSVDRAYETHTKVKIHGEEEE